MIKTILRSTLAIGLAAAAFTSTAEARSFGGGFHGDGFGGRGIAVGEPNPSMPHHGGFHHHGDRGRGFGWYGVGFPPNYDDGCYRRRFIDEYGTVVIRRVCD